MNVHQTSFFFSFFFLFSLFLFCFVLLYITRCVPCVCVSVFIFSRLRAVLTYITLITSRALYYGRRLSNWHYFIFIISSCSSFYPFRVYMLLPILYCTITVCKRLYTVSIAYTLLQMLLAVAVAFYIYILCILYHYCILLFSGSSREGNKNDCYL